jgi:4-hydroxybenzoyl-CoA reductase subunit alpha
MALVTAEELGIPPSDINVLSADTETTPVDSGTHASRVTFFSGNATLIAAREVKAQLSEIGAKLLEANEDDLVFKDRKIYVKGSPNRFIPFGDLARKTEAYGHGRLIIGRGSWAPTNTQFPDRKTQYGNVAGAYSFTAQVAEVEVDRKTGKVSLLSLTIGDDCGQVINLLGAEGQAEGSTAMGAGHALMENLLIDDIGQIMNPSLLTYTIPTALDCNEVTLLEVGRPDSMGPFGAKEIGEGLMIATVPAICNAIYDATGIRITQLPVTQEKILEAMENKERRKEP